jgi:hypothetical protein
MEEVKEKRVGVNTMHYSCGFPYDWTLSSGVEIWKPVQEALKEDD